MLFKIQDRKPRFRRTPEFAFRIQARDRHIIYQVFKHRFLTSEHIRALVPGSDQGVLRRLQLLFHGGYLDRPPEQIRPYRKGSDPMVYGLGNKGADLLALEYGIARARVDWTSKNREATKIFLDHSLMVANFMVCLEVACARLGGVRLMESTEILRQVVPQKQRREPIGWKVKTRLYTRGEKRNVVLPVVPDKFFGLHFPNDPPGSNKCYFFLESDRSTMPVKRSDFLKTSFVKKMIAYWESLHQDLYQEHFGIGNARILTITKSQERIESMIEAGKEIDERGKGSPMFLFAREEEFTIKNPDRTLASVWQNGMDDQLISLLD